MKPEHGEPTIRPWRRSCSTGTLRPPAVANSRSAILAYVAAVERAHRRQAKVWTTEWDTGPFDRRIPVLSGADDRRLLGLASPRGIEDFLADLLPGAIREGVCRG